MTRCLPASGDKSRVSRKRGWTPSRRSWLRMAALVFPGAPQIVLDGQPTEDTWALAQPLRTAVWQASAYETGQPEPVIRLLAGANGLYICVEARDDCISGFRWAQVLSDAVFVVATPAFVGPEEQAGMLPVVTIFPFGGEPKAVRGPWKGKWIEGLAADGVQAAVAKPADGRGWTCEAFVPWRTLLDTDSPPSTLRLNVGVWDNDGDLFTELHSWAPMADTALWGTLEIAVP